MLIFQKRKNTIGSLRNTPLSSSGHFGLKTRLDGHKQRTQNKLFILEMACAFVSAYPSEN